MRASSALLLAILAATLPGFVSSAQIPSARSANPNAAKIIAAPEIIFYNGVIYTGVGMNEDRPQTVEAIAIGGGKVLAIGTSNEISRLAGPKTRLHDLSTATTSVFIFPGFNDAHVHLGSAGQTKLNVDLTGVQSLAEMLAKVE